MKLYDIALTTIDGEKTHMAQFKDQVLLVVNTACL